jgi:thiopurine S-methyltransferase
MQPDFWLERWRDGRIGFHRAEPNQRLIENAAVLSNAIRVVVPLFGKSHDLEWLIVHGFEVTGVELSELAVQAFFAERALVPNVRTQAKFVVYEHGNLAIWVGDFFATSSKDLGLFDAVYDRAALIALPPELRPQYAAHLQTLLAPQAKLLLVTLHTDASGGPPFSVPPEEVMDLYRSAQIKPLASVDARADFPGPVERGASFVHENVYAVSFGEPG